MINVPILIRSLADSLADVPEDDLPIPLSHNILAALDAGINHKNPGCLVPVYRFNWWDATDADEIPNPDDVLTSKNLDDCLDLHRSQLPSSDIPLSAPSSTLPSRTVVNPNCEGCQSLQHIADGLLNELLASHQFADGMKESSFSKSDISIRDGTGLYMLHERAQQKDKHFAPAAPTPDPSHPGPSSRRGKLSKKVAQRAQAELERYRSLPQASLKWTWGADVTEADVRNLVTLPKRTHSGYRKSMPHGHYSGIWSNTASLPAGTELFSAISSNLVPSLESLHIQTAQQPDYSSLADSAADAFIAEENLDVPVPRSLAAADAFLTGLTDSEDDADHHPQATQSSLPHPVSSVDYAARSNLASDIYLTDLIDADTDDADADAEDHEHFKHDKPPRLYGVEDFGYVTPSWIPDDTDMEVEE